MTCGIFKDIVTHFHRTNKSIAMLKEIENAAIAGQTIYTSSKKLADAIKENHPDWDIRSAEESLK